MRGGLKASTPSSRVSREVPAPHEQAETISEALPRIPDRLVDDVTERFRSNLPVRRRLPGWGRIHIDRQLPFLFVYRRPSGPDPGTDRLVVGEAAYLTTDTGPSIQTSVSHLVSRLADVGTEVFGGYLVVELWAARREHERPELEAVQKPAFRVAYRTSPELTSTVETLGDALRGVRIRGQSAIVDVDLVRRVAPTGCAPLLRFTRGALSRAHLIGIEVSPVYQAADGTFPLVLRDLHRGLARALKKGAFHFGRTLTTHRPPHYHALGRRAFVKAVWEADRRLAAISDGFDFILSVTPVNARPAWNRFRQSRFEKPPKLLYRPLTVSPGRVKRELFAIPVDAIEDPELAWVFRQKQYELDRELTALFDRDTPRFRYGSLQVFGPVDDQLLQQANELLERLPSRSRTPARAGVVDAEAFAARARDELAYFRERYSDVASTVQVRDDINGLIVSKGSLNVPSDLSIPAARLEALIQHEVGTHVLTHVNGCAQPFRQLHAGLAGYDELQEGVAVLAEYLVGGLTPARLRLLAARVAAVRYMLNGATFVETFRELDRRYDFNQETAFSVTLRVFRGGGLTKDASYLRGLVSVVAFLQRGGDLKSLLVGKIAFEHLALVQELRRREVLRPPPLTPRYLSDSVALERLRYLAEPGTTVVDLVKRKRGL